MATLKRHKTQHRNNRAFQILRDPKPDPIQDESSQTVAEDQPPPPVAAEAGHEEAEARAATTEEEPVMEQPRDKPPPVTAEAGYKLREERAATTEEDTVMEQSQDENAMPVPRRGFTREFKEEFFEEPVPTHNNEEIDNMGRTVDRLSLFLKKWANVPIQQPD